MNISESRCDEARISWRKEPIGNDFQHLRYRKEPRYG
jgi:hypothetical protein